MSNYTVRNITDTTIQSTDLIIKSGSTLLFVVTDDIGKNPSYTSSIFTIAPTGLIVSGSTNIEGTASYANTASFLPIGTYNITSSWATNSSQTLTASYAPNYVLNSSTSSMLSPYLLSSQTGSFTTTSSFNSFTSSYNTGSFTGSFTGALTGTASWATTATNATQLNGQAASYYLNATNINAGTIGNSYLPTQINVTGVTASFVGNLIGTSSWATNASTASFLPIGTYSITSSWAQSSSQALTASYTPNALITASVSSNVLTFTKGNGSTFNLTVTPGGSDTQIQFNSASAFSGSANFIFNYLSRSLQQGNNVTASGQYSHAEGLLTTVTGYGSHTEGYLTTAAGEASHAEGASTSAAGIHSHAEGYNTVASGSHSHAEGFATATYRTTPTPVSSSETLYAYNTGSGLLVGNSSYTSTNQNAYVLWEDVNNNQVWLSTVNGTYSANPDGFGTRIIFSISEFDSQGPSTNVSSGGASYDFEAAISGWGVPYNIGKFNYNSSLIEVYNQDLTLLSTPNGVLVTIPNSGSYAYNVSSVTYSSNTSSISIGLSQFGGNNNGAPSLTGAIVTLGKVFLTNITGSSWVTEGNLINSPIAVDSYYNFASKTFKLSGGIGQLIKPNTIAVINNTERWLTGANFDGFYSYVTTSAQLNPIYGAANAPLIEFGNGSHAGGANTVVYGNYQTVVGVYNTNVNYKDLFVVGGGVDNGTRKDVLAVSTDGVVISGSVNISGSLTVNGTAITGTGGGGVSKGFVIAMAAAM